jgi:hypothetical protein
VRFEKGVPMATSVHLLKLFVGLSTLAETRCLAEEKTGKSKGRKQAA